MITSILFIAVVLFVLYGLVASTDKFLTILQVKYGYTRRQEYAVIDKHSVKYRSGL